MSTRKGYRLLAIVAALAALAGCATNRIARCEGHLVPINPPPPKPARAVPAPRQKSQSPRNAEHKP
jgi:hypothetical protein